MALFPADFGRRIRRVVQKADQNFGRAEKSEVLTDKIQDMEKQLEFIRQSFQGTAKRLQACLPPPADPDKRLKRLPESALSVSLNESAGLLSQCESHVFSKVFSSFAEVEQSLADALIQFTLEVEKSVLQPLNGVIDKDIPAIMRLRRQLANMTLDMDSAKKAFLTLQKQTQVQPGKMDSAREDMEAEEVKVDQCRDQLITEMYQFFAHEEKLCKMLLSVMRIQADYHRNALDLLNQQISQMSEEIEQSSRKPVFGVDLGDHLSFTKQDIATVIEVCVQLMQRIGLEEEGIFRIAPSASKLRKLTAAFDANITDIEGDDVDVHCLAGALKLYLRELPDPLMTFELFDDWAYALQRPNVDRSTALLAVVNRLPKANYDNLGYLMKFMSKVVEQSDTNKMSAMNLAIVLGPNLLYPPKTTQNSVQMTGVALSVVETLISHSNWFFPNISLGSSSPPSLNEADGIEVNMSESPGKHGHHKQLEKLKVPVQTTKKALAPVPPHAPLGRQRSDGTPDYLANSHSPDISWEKKSPNFPGKLKLPEKVTPPPLISKKPNKSTGSVDLVEHVSLEEKSVEKAELNCRHDDLPIYVEENPLSTHSRLVRSRAAEEHDGDVGPNRLEIFTPTETPAYANLDAGVSNGCISTSKESREPVQKTEPAAAASVACSNFLKKTATNSSHDNLQDVQDSELKASKVLGHTRNKSYTETTPLSVSSTSSSSSSSIFNFSKYHSAESKDKSASLPTDSVSLCAIKYRSEDGSIEIDRNSPLGSKQETEVKGKPNKPKPLPRSPLKEGKSPTLDDKFRYAPAEDTHL